MPSPHPAKQNNPHEAKNHLRAQEETYLKTLALPTQKTT